MTVIVAGFLVAFARYTARMLAVGPEQAFPVLKVRLARTLLLGLEILVLADIIETIAIDASYDSLLVLAILVFLRTAVSWTLALQAEGRWPWQPEVRS